jgi:hypothetical protein
VAPTVFNWRHPRQLQEGHAHLLGIAKARQPADVLDWQVGPFEEVTRLTEMEQTGRGIDGKAQNLCFLRDFRAISLSEI